MSSLGVCLKHQTKAAVFRCRQCTDLGCPDCRATGEKDLCRICAEYHHTIDRIEAQGGMDALAGARPRAQWGRRLIVGLAVLNLLALTVWFSTRSESAPDVVVSVALRDAAAAVSSVVEQHRDGSGRYPMSLDTVGDRLSPEVIEMVRRGDITYWTSPDNLQYEVKMWPPGTISLRARSWRALPRRRPTSARVRLRRRSILRSCGHVPPAQPEQPRGR